GNEAYGATPSGMTIWWLGTVDNTPYADAAESVIKDFHVWHVHQQGFFGYPTNRVVIDSMVARNDKNLVEGEGIWCGDYLTKNSRVTNSDIQGFRYGFSPGANTGGGTQTVEDSFFSNYYNI